MSDTVYQLIVSNVYGLEIVAGYARNERLIENNIYKLTI